MEVNHPIGLHDPVPGDVLPQYELAAAGTAEAQQDHDDDKHRHPDPEELVDGGGAGR
jgi:hypothetical protein